MWNNVALFIVYIVYCLYFFYQCGTMWRKFYGNCYENFIFKRNLNQRSCIAVEHNDLKHVSKMTLA